MTWPTPFPARSNSAATPRTRRPGVSAIGAVITAPIALTTPVRSRYLHSGAQQRGAEPEAGPGPGVTRRPPLVAGPDERLALLPFQLVGRPLHHAERHGHPGRGLRPQRGVGGLSPQAAIGDGVQHGGHAGADLARCAHAPLVPGC